MRVYAQRRYETFSVTCYKLAVKCYLYRVQELPLSQYVNIKLNEFAANAIKRRYPAWFSTAYDTIEVQPGYGHFGDCFYVWKTFGFGDSDDFLGRSGLRWVGATGELLPSETIDHPETDFHQLLKTKRDATVQAAQLATPRALDQFVRFPNLPPEIRIIIYDLMVRLTRGPLSLLCLLEDFNFITGLDHAPPIITAVCREMRGHVMRKYQKVSLDYMVLRTPPLRMDLQILFVPNPYPWPLFEVAQHARCEFWFSVECDDVKVEFDRRWEWAVKEVWTDGPGGPYVGHISQLTRSTPFHLPSVLNLEMNGLRRHTITKIEEAIRDAQRETQLHMLEGDTREDDAREVAEES
ncbi:hypothetical protein PG991_012413 [Apiospora marii]|uniref:2EXR domain-containing protein n=1 Tax=Apiospora marii TaxID=335849 RepID=A0ABR1RAJ4_9PEZI